MLDDRLPRYGRATSAVSVRQGHAKTRDSRDVTNADLAERASRPRAVDSTLWRYLPSSSDQKVSEGDLNSPPLHGIWRRPAVTSTRERYPATPETAPYRSIPTQGARCHWQRDAPRLTLGHRE